MIIVWKICSMEVNSISHQPCMDTMIITIPSGYHNNQPSVYQDFLSRLCIIVGSKIWCSNLQYGICWITYDFNFLFNIAGCSKVLNSTGSWFQKLTDLNLKESNAILCTGTLKPTAFNVPSGPLLDPTHTSHFLLKLIFQIYFSAFCSFWLWKEVGLYGKTQVGWRLANHTL